MKKELPKVYAPAEFEPRIYEEWEKNRYFRANVNPDAKPFTIVMPPPNVTGQLHMGHAMDASMQDALIRFKRMQGYEALYLPGVDHAGIATQIKVEEELRKEGLTRHDLGREKFLEKVWEWKNQYGNRIVEQQKKLGCSCDWERSRFTMDDVCSKAVREVFVSLYEKGLIYKGSRIINWCPHCVTALSDAEVEYVDKPGFLWHIRYPLADGSGEVIVATTRPETMLGDSGVCVNPNDDRYRSIVGKKVILPLVNKEIPIVADDYAEMDFGTGCVKMTPAHDPNDFEVGLRHHLEVIRVLDDNGHVNELGGRYQGMDRYEARKTIVEDLEKGGYLVKVEPYQHNVGTCYRCHQDVEPLISAQWFVKMEPLAKEALRVVRDGETRFVPERFSKTYLNWMENVRDWCISRQLWWGHQIPAWICDDCGHITVSRTDAEVCEKCGSAHIHREEDVLDTWFSSALWPFETLGWPEKTKELDYFYPTDVLVTGYDIIFFWVARMIFSSCEHLNTVPFRTVLIHGLVRDAQGRKMSKSLGNGIDPVEVINQYGNDSLRFSLLNGTSPGLDTRMSQEKIEAGRNFCNKIWNAARFVLMNLGEEETFAPDTLPDPSDLAPEDRWILTCYNNCVREVTDAMEKYELGLAIGKLYDFMWDNFCDWYIELTKDRLYAGGKPAEHATQVLCYVLSNTLKLLHPFLPFLTEEIWQSLPHEGESIMISRWPVYDKALDFTKEAADVEAVMDAVRAIRNRRAEMNVAPSRKTKIYVESDRFDLFRGCTRFFVRLANCTSVEAGVSDGVSIVTGAARITIPMAELVDLEAERSRLNKELAAAEKDVAGLTAKLSNPGFLAKAPANVVAEQRDRLEKQTAKINGIRETLAKL